MHLSSTCILLFVLYSVLESMLYMFIVRHNGMLIWPKEGTGHPSHR